MSVDSGQPGEGEKLTTSLEGGAMNAACEDGVGATGRGKMDSVGPDFVGHCWNITESVES